MRILPVLSSWLLALIACLGQGYKMGQDKKKGSWKMWTRPPEQREVRRVSKEEDRSWGRWMRAWGGMKGKMTNLWAFWIAEKSKWGLWRRGWVVLCMEKAMATHSSTLAWKIPWMEKPGRLQSLLSLRVGHDFTFTFTFHFHALEKEMATHSSVLA